MAIIPFLNNAFFAAKVGIGTESPDTLLHLYNPSANWGTEATITLGTDTEGLNQAQLKYYRGSNSATESFQLSVRGTTALTALYNGNVGIGTTSPTGKLQIDGTAGTNELLLIKNTDTGGVASALTIEGIGSSSSIIDLNRGVAGRIAGTRYSTSGTTDFFSGLYYNGGNGQSNFGIGTDRNAANQKLVITPTGNVGIGTTSPGKKLDVEGNIRSIITGGSTSAEIDISSGATWRLRSNPTTGTNSYGLDIVKGAAGTDVKMSINSSGNVGIGTDSPAQKLQVIGGNIAVDNTYGYHIKDAAGTLRWALRAQATDDLEIGDSGFDDMLFTVGGVTNAMVIKQVTGNVGIGTTSPNNILELSKQVSSGIGPILQLTNSQYSLANNSGSSIQFRGYTVWGPGSTNPRYSEINAINGESLRRQSGLNPNDFGLSSVSDNATMRRQRAVEEETRLAELAKKAEEEEMEELRRISKERIKNPLSDLDLDD